MYSKLYPKQTWFVNFSQYKAEQLVDIKQHFNGKVWVSLIAYKPDGSVHFTDISLHAEGLNKAQFRKLRKMLAVI